MEWVHLSKDAEAALEEVRTGGDRAAAIVAAALVDEHLGRVIIASLRQNKRIAQKMFTGSGPLATFSSKIDLAFLIGMFSEECCKELHTIRDIRNTFAHDLNTGFDNQRVKDLANNLIRHESGASFTLTNVGRKVNRSLVYVPEPTKAINARDRYIRSCQYYTAILSMHLPGRVTMPAPFF